MSDHDPGRRAFLALGGGMLALPGAAPPANAGLVRVASVATDVEGGLLPALLASFHAASGLELALSFGNDPYALAAQGMADLVIAHFGHRDTERFVQSGAGLWPRTVFANQLALLGPAADRAGVAGLPSLVEAFRRIAQGRHPYLLNDTPGIGYLTDILWHASGKPARGAWFLEGAGRKGAALALAAERGAYMLWGLTPFLREQAATASPLRPLLTADPMLQRIMVAVVVNPARVAGVNAAGAGRLQDYLLAPAVQASMLEIHYPGFESAAWAPAGRHNAGALLPDSTRKQPSMESP